MRHENTQKGSALFIILIAVVLFAALSYTVAQMMRGGDVNAIGEEKSKLYAEEILNIGRAMRQAAQNLKISNGCSDLDISVENDFLSGYVHAPAARDNCKIFHSGGGGMIYTEPSKDWLDLTVSPAPSLRGEWFFPGDVCMPGIGSAPTGTGCNSDGVDNEVVVAVLPYIRREVCVMINRSLGVTTLGAPPTENGHGWTLTADKFTGAQTDGERLDESFQAGCFQGSGGSTPGSNTYHFFQVLVPR